ncbi:MAG: glycosyltransferase family 2 protein [Chloroflexi bacterium]|nr:glycosyltransferase family 2 protein [Chloroflexota bacterium]
MLASIIIPNWNGARFLPTCLASLRAQTCRDFEAVVVDNGSSDNSVELLAADYREVRVIRLPSNLFFSGAVNEGIRQTQSQIVVLLNNDTEAEPGWLASLVEALEWNPDAGMAASKMLLFDRRDILNSAGDCYGTDGIPNNRGVWERDEGQFDDAVDVFGACAGAAAYRREMLEAIGLFDEDFVGYCEDVDLNFRAQLAGYRCVFAPGARVYHRLSATGGGPVASFFCGRNFINVMVKNMPSALIWRFWPRILGAQLRYFGQSLRHFREPAARARLRGQLAGLGYLPRMLSKRKEVKQLQRVPVEYIESILTH